MDECLDIKNGLMDYQFGSLAESRQRIDFAFERIDSIEDLRQNVRKFIAKHKSKNSKSLAKSQTYRQKGNQLFRKRSFELSLYYYNLAVMHSPYPSDDSNLDSANELCYAFTSRSLTFFEMGFYSNALFDINCALNVSQYSMNFSQQLQLIQHKVYCLCLLERYEESEKLIANMIQLIPCLSVNNDLIKRLLRIQELISERKSQNLRNDLEIESDSEVIHKYCKDIDNYFSDCIDLSETEGKGRHYMANKDIPKRSIVSIERSIAGILFESFFRTHCQYCFKNIGYKCWPCRQCSQVVFCDQQCAQNAYYHYYECGIADVIDCLGANHYILYRIVLLVGPKVAIDLANQRLNEKEFYDKKDSNKTNYLRFLQLTDHRNNYDLKTKVLSTHRSIQLALIFDYFEEFKPKDQSIEEYMKELSTVLDSHNFKILVNAFGMYEQKTSCRSFRGDHIGNAICFINSFFNHSCSANCFWQFNGQYITIASIKDIHCGQELNVCYGPYEEGMAFNERQEFLKRRYFFQCNCKACVTDARHLPSLKCHYCSNGFILYESNRTESSCMVCNKSFQISSIIERVNEIEESFQHWINEFEKTSKSETLLLMAEMCFQNFSHYLNPRSDRMIEINEKLSRSFEMVANYSKAMIYSKNILQTLEDCKAFRHSVEMVFYSRLYYYYLSKQRKSFTFDDQWNKCFQFISETILVLKNCRKLLIEIQSNESSELIVITKAKQMIESCLKTKERQIYFISKLNSK